MEIYIDNTQLHVTKSDVVLNWANIRFSEAVADEWSTEVELPNDKHNINLLGAYGLLDRGAIFNHRVKCSVLVDDIAKDGYLQVLTIEENTIKARVYVISIPYAVLDKKVCEYYPHDDVVFRWDRFSPITTNIAGVNEGIIPYEYTNTDFYSNILAQWHASVSVQKVLDNIQVAEDITLPAVDNTLFQLAANKKVCPSNTLQVLEGYLIHTGRFTDKKLVMHGGQHITNDFKSDWTYSNFVWNQNWTDWNATGTNISWMANSTGSDTITYNRYTNAHIKVYVSGSYDPNDPIGMWVVPQKNGNNLCPQSQCVVKMMGQTWTENDILIYEDNVTFREGDTFSLAFTRNTYTLTEETVYYSVVINYFDYEWDDDDYSDDLVYIPAPFMIRCVKYINGAFNLDWKYDFSGTGDGTNSPEDYSFTYFGAYSNLDRDITVREYLTSLCWIHNQKLKLDRNELIFQNANQREVITANLTTITPSSDKLGQTNIITYRDSDTPTQFDIDNEFLESEKTLHENKFYTGDIIPQYSYDMTYSEQTNDDGDSWVTDINVNFDDLSPVIMTAVDRGGSTYWLYHAPDIVGFGLTDLTNAQQISAQTLKDISNLDYVYMEGHKYMLIDGEYDLNTSITEFNAIQCDFEIGCIPPNFAVIDTIPYQTEITVMYSYTDIGGNSTGTVQLYKTERPTIEIDNITDISYTEATATLEFAEGSGEQLIMEDEINKGVTSITFNNLEADMVYRITFTITNECGDNITQTIVTDTLLHNEPIVDMSIYNITNNTAIGRVDFTEQ